MPARSDQQPQVPQQIPQQVPAMPVQAAPIPQREVTQEELQRQALQERARTLREAPRAIPVRDVAVIIGIQTKDNGRQETMIDIGEDFRILECTQTTKEKVRAVTQDGQFLGYEPTGEYEFTLKVKYLKDT